MRPRELTSEEMRAAFLGTLLSEVAYWSRGSGLPPDALWGLASSFLSMLDGTSPALPAFELVAAPHPEERAHCQAEGENWWPELTPGLEKSPRLHGGVDGCVLLRDEWRKMWRKTYGAQRKTEG